VPETGNRPSDLSLTDARARKVFHAALIEYLNESGAESVSEMRSKPFECFRVPLKEDESQVLVESARRHGLVAPLAHDRTASGSAIREVEWSPTERGRRVKPVRTLAPGDLLLSIRDMANPAREFVSAWISIATLLASLLFVELSDPSPGLKGAAVALSTTLVVYFVLIRGITAEYCLRTAVRAWPRLEEAHLGQYRWHTKHLRFWLGPVSMTFVATGMVVGVLFSWRPGAALAGVGIVVAVVGAVLIHPLRRASTRPPDG
jgi:hypothetical protein